MYPSSDFLQQTIDRFWETVPPVWNIVRSNVRSEATQQFNITVEQFHILRHIRRGAHSVSELADIGHISRPAISQAVDALVSKGMVSRTQNVNDRRYFRLELTKEGTALLDTVFSQTRQWMQAKLSTLELTDLESIMAGLGLLKKAFCDK
ncbi:MAG: MarR family transcriptional regulator [Anaerolineaceae bacterium]|nr:MarR family transcriptional regulator [Anaerolineaceae bacterium]